MNSISINLHSYYNKFVNLYNYILINMSFFGQNCVNFTHFSIIKSLM